MVEFSEIASPFGSEREERMADEIVQLRAVVAKLREPSDQMVKVLEMSIDIFATVSEAMMKRAIVEVLEEAEREANA